MPSILFLIIILLAVALVSLAFYAYREAKKHDTSAKEEFIGICKSAIETASEKEARKKSVLALLREHGEVGNAEIGEALGVASRTVVKYMDELQEEGKVEQVGVTGRGVMYKEVNQ
ncbi:MAG: winged helix-turn-helix domain-containing protein [bacterium]|nr:winged helix-turn-helix domain-containing protein [bacterium]